MGGEVEVDVLPFDAAADVFDAPPAVAGNIHDGAEGIVAGVGGDRPPVGFFAGGGDAYFFGFSFLGSRSKDGLEFPVAFPAATFTAFAVSGGFHFYNLRFLVAGNAVSFPGSASAECDEEEREDEDFSFNHPFR